MIILFKSLNWQQNTNACNIEKIFYFACVNKYYVFLLCFFLLGHLSELKAHVSFSDRLLSVVRLSICL